MRRLLLLLAIGILASREVAAQRAPQSTPAHGIFNVMNLLLATQPVTSDAEFEAIQKSLDFYDFHREANGWSFENSTGKVFLAVRPSVGSVVIMLLPNTPERFGDAALAALIARATSVAASEGNVIDLELPARSLVTAKHTGTATDHVAFYLNGGTWMRTTTSIDWVINR